MKNSIGNYVEQFRQDRQKQIRLVAILAALAVVVAGVIFWQLHNTGVAMTNEVYCGQEEHVHNENCYETILVCGLDESEGHVHNDSCCETVLTCEIPEHTHTIECMTDESADVETADDWEATLPGELSGVWTDDVVAIAESQIGYTESEQNFRLADDGETHMGYTRYGAWYGNEYGDWDAMFAAFCLNYAGLSEEEMPFNSGAYAWTAALSDSGLYVASDLFTPREGDLIFFDADEDEKADTVGIVTAIDKVTGDLTVIEGNSGDSVAENEYEPDNEMIVGYGLLPEQTADEDAEATVEEETQITEYDDAEIETDGAKGKTEAITEYETVLTYDGADYTVTVSYDTSAEIPDDTELVVSEYLKDTPGYLARYAEASDLYNWENEDINESRLFNIGLYFDGEEIDPFSQVQVKITFPSFAEDNEIYLATSFKSDVSTLDIEATEDNGEETISYSACYLSDVLISTVAEEDDGISLLATSSRSNFNFITSNVSFGSGNEPVTVNGNTFNFISTSKTPVDSGAALTMNKNNATVSGSLISTATYSSTGDMLLLMDVSSLASGGSSSGKVGNTKFDAAVQGKTGSTLTNIGTVTFADAGTINGKSVNVIVTFDSVRMYNSFAEDFGTTGYPASANGYVGLCNNKICIGRISGARMWIGQNYCTDVNAQNARYTSSYYTYPCIMDEELTVAVEYADGSGQVNDASFLQVASDIDIYFNDSDGSQSAGRHGQFAETFQTVSGFTGNYYIYPSDLDNINSASGGVVTVQANSSTENAEGTDEGTTGNDEYTEAGIYADTEDGSWTVSYSEGWCSTAVEVYSFSTDITIKKADAADLNNVLENAEFLLYKYVDGTIYYYSGYEVINGVNNAVWSVDIEDAEKLITDENGLAYAYGLSTGDYYLKELTAPDGYNVIDHDIQFTLESYQIITTGDPNATVEDPDQLIITIEDTAGTILPNTGGAGSTIFYIAGALLVTTAAVTLVYNKRRLAKS